MKEISRELFEAWLFSQPKEREFNYMDNTGGCAVCAFVRETTSHANAKGGAKTVEIGNRSIQMPEWLRAGTQGVLSVADEDHCRCTADFVPVSIRGMQKRYRQLNR